MATNYLVLILDSSFRSFFSAREGAGVNVDDTSYGKSDRGLLRRQNQRIVIVNGLQRSFVSVSSIDRIWAMRFARVSGFLAD